MNRAESCQVFKKNIVLEKLQQQGILTSLVSVRLFI
jgi:hypothetical protein